MAARAFISTGRRPHRARRQHGRAIDRRDQAQLQNTLFVDGSAEHWAVIAPLIETCRINKIDPLADVLTRIVNGHAHRDIDQLLPWAYRTQSLKAVALEAGGILSKHFASSALIYLFGVARFFRRWFDT